MQGASAGAANAIIAALATRGYGTVSQVGKRFSKFKI